MQSNERYMRRAFELAKLGAGSVSPNPLVGCVIVGKNGEVIGEGAHLEFGGPHAEPNAVRDAEGKGHSVQGATAFVTLEPHAHQGKTPPCTKLLIEKGIAKVVVAMEDPNPEVSGKGIRELRDNGVEVERGILETEARELNRFFIKHITTGFPYVTLKIASSLDGRSALANGESKWITSEASRRIVHQMRAEYDAVLIGAGTARADNPSLTPRLVEGRVPFRIVLDSKLELPLTLNLFSDDDCNRTIVVTNSKLVAKAAKLKEIGVDILPIDLKDAKIDLSEMLKRLGQRNIVSILVEAGPSLASSLVREHRIDEMMVFVAPKILGSDAQPSIGPLALEKLPHAPHLRLISITTVENSGDILLRFLSNFRSTN